MPSDDLMENDLTQFLFQAPTPKNASNVAEVLAAYVDDRYIIHKRF